MQRDIKGLSTKYQKQIFELISSENIKEVLEDI